jgi:hypothetical protein
METTVYGQDLLIDISHSIPQLKILQLKKPAYAGLSIAYTANNLAYRVKAGHSVSGGF